MYTPRSSSLRSYDIFLYIVASYINLLIVKKTYLTNYIFFIKNEGVGGLLLLTSILQLKSANSVVSSAAFARSFTHKSGDFHTYYLCFVSASREFLLLNIHELTSNRSALLQRH